jgi:hypothetical protein
MDNIKIYLREVAYEVVDWIHLAQDRDPWQVKYYCPFVFFSLLKYLKFN